MTYTQLQALLLAGLAVILLAVLFRGQPITCDTISSIEMVCTQDGKSWVRNAP